MPLHSFERLVALADPWPDDPAVRLELRLAGATGPDPTAQPLEVRPLSHEARQEIRELGQLDLELALARPRPLGEDVQDERGPVDDAEVERPREVPLLHR